MVSDKLFYRCSVCGNIVAKVFDGGGELACCGQPMVLLTANTTDAALEKHVPAVTREGSKIHVQVGSTIHPMLPEHYIMWIAAVQDDLFQQIDLKPGDQPVVDFNVNDGPVTVYEYCNLHGLWKAE